MLENKYILLLFNQTKICIAKYNKVEAIKKGQTEAPTIWSLLWQIPRGNLYQ